MIYIIEVVFLLIGLYFAYEGGKARSNVQGWRNIFLTVVYTGGAFTLMLLDWYFT